MSRRSGRLQARQENERTSNYETEENQQLVCTRKRKTREQDMVETTRTEVQKRRQEFRIENHWVPISESSTIETSRLVPTSNREATTPSEELMDSANWVTFRNLFPAHVSERASPVTLVRWAELPELWSIMTRQETLYPRQVGCLKGHPSLGERMRSILLDWLIEVCEVYRLHRETFYLAVDFVDRYLAANKNIPKTKLQLIGITALFIAAKLEEIYPPKLHEFAYVTDGACSDDEILNQELVILKALKWDLSPITVNTWLNAFMQICNADEIANQNTNFHIPAYSSSDFIKVAQLLDVCTLDIGSLDFEYSTLAASALYHMTNEELTLEVTGMKWDDIAVCVQWMSAFAITIREMGVAQLKSFKNVFPGDAHNIQTHCSGLELLEKSQQRLKEIREAACCSPVQVPGVLTPPQSNEKGYKGVL
ncbi:G1/S-specific cyclin-E-like [Diadema antillarum]|uniref:G1/S-specific cyclin-E-like n=1 Tax=Diadema antillarum TaxID=105358 RepID=UPI003A8856F2